MKRILLILLFCCLCFFSSAAQDYHSVSSWLKAIQSKENSKRFNAALALNSLSANKTTEWQKLLKAASSLDPFVRVYVAQAIGNFKIPPAMAMPVLIRLFDDKEQRVREYACLAAIKYEIAGQPYLFKATINDRSSFSEYCGSIRNTTLFAAIALRNMDSLNLRKMERNIRLKRAFKALIYDAYMDNFDSYAYVDSGKIRKRSPADYYQAPEPVNQVVVSDKNSQVSFISKHGISEQETEKRIAMMGPAWSYDLPSVVMLTNNPELFRKRKDLYTDLPSGQGQFGYIPYLNLGHNGQHLLPSLLSGKYAELKYRIAGNILFDLREQISFNLPDTAVAITKPGGVLPLEYVTHIFPKMLGSIGPSFYQINRFGVGTQERALMHIPLYDEMLTLADNATELKKIRKLYLTENTIPRYTNITTDSPGVKQFFNLGMDTDNVQLRITALHYLSFLSPSDTTLDVRLRKALFDDDPRIQDAAARTIRWRSPNKPELQSALARIDLDQAVIGFFHDEITYFFESDGWNPVCKWEAGPGPHPQKRNLANWPPPPPTGESPIDITKYKTGNRSVNDLMQKLAAILQSSNYPVPKVYTIPDGIVMITRCENTDAAGNILRQNRWIKAKNDIKSFSDYTRILLHGNAGYYRYLFFVLNKHPEFKRSGTQNIDISTFDKVYLTGQPTILPDNVGSMPMTGYYLQGFIYQFYRRNGGMIIPVSEQSSSLNAQQQFKDLHLTNAFK